MMFVLFSVWCLFFWLGELISLTLFDYSSSLTVVYSPSFYRFKYHTFYSSFLFSSYLSFCISVYIYFTAFVSFTYLLNIYAVNRYQTSHSILDAVRLLLILIFVSYSVSSLYSCDWAAILFSEI
jgi:hypothetical protein